MTGFVRIVKLWCRSPTELVDYSRMPTFSFIRPFSLIYVLWLYCSIESALKFMKSLSVLSHTQQSFPQPHHIHCFSTEWLKARGQISSEYYWNFPEFTSTFNKFYSIEIFTFSSILKFTLNFNETPQRHDDNFPPEVPQLEALLSVTSRPLYTCIRWCFFPRCSFIK